MKKFIPYDKMSKKAKKEYNAKQRNSWGLVNPSSRIEKSSKEYSRKVKHKGAKFNDDTLLP